MAYELRSAVKMDCQAFLLPYFTYFGHDNALQVDLGVPLVMPLQGVDGGFESYF